MSPDLGAAMVRARMAVGDNPCDAYRETEEVLLAIHLKEVLLAIHLKEVEDINRRYGRHREPSSDEPNAAASNAAASNAAASNAAAEYFTGVLAAGIVIAAMLIALIAAW